MALVHFHGYPNHRGEAGTEETPLERFRVLVIERNEHGHEIRRNERGEEIPHTMRRALLNTVCWGLDDARPDWMARLQSQGL